MFSLGLLELIVIGVIAIIAIVGALFLIPLMMGRRPKVDPDAGLEENLAEYPPAPPAGTHQLLFEGQPVRLRLVVLAPAGRGTVITADMAEGLLQTVLHGLGEVADLDRPRIRIWPSQLSQDGFAPKFFDNVLRPEASDKPSRWVLAAGPARAGQKTLLVGLALQTTKPTSRGNVRMNAEIWHDKFRVQVLDE